MLIIRETDFEVLNVLKLLILELGGDYAMLLLVAMESYKNLEHYYVYRLTNYRSYNSLLSTNLRFSFLVSSFG